MTIEEMERLSRIGNMGLEACAIRVRAAQKVTGLLMQKELAAAAGVTNTALNNAIAGLNYPSRDLMKYLYRAHRIDFNFILNGDFAQLPADVRERLFPALSSAEHEWDQRENSDRGRTKPKDGPAAA